MPKKYLKRKRWNKDSSIYKHLILQWTNWCFIYTKNKKKISIPFYCSRCVDALKKGRGHLSLVTFGYEQGGMSLISSFSSSSKMTGPLSQFPVSSPSPTLRLNIDSCIKVVRLHLLLFRTLTLVGQRNKLLLVFWFSNTILKPSCPEEDTWYGRARYTPVVLYA